MNKQILSLGLIILSGLIFSLILLNKHRESLVDFHKKSDQRIVIPEKIRYYDEVLTMSAYMAVLKHDTKWIERYNNAVPPLENVLMQARKIFPEIIVYLDEIEEEVETLISLELQSFELLKQNRFDEATSLLFSEKYDNSKRNYNRHLEKIINTIEVSTKNLKKKSEENFTFLLLMIISIILLTLFLSVVSYIVFNKQTKELETSKESLENQHMLLQKIIDLVPVGMFWKDMDGIYLGANKQFVEDAQLNDVSEIIGKTDYNMTWKRDAKRFIEDDATVVNSGVPRLLYEEEQPKEDGSCIYLVTSKVPLRDIRDNIIGILGVYSDITESKILQKEAKAKDKQLLIQSRMAQMGEMISMIAHQWRQPLTSITATVANIKMKSSLNMFDLSKEEEAKEYEVLVNDHTDKITSYVENLSATISDFRNFFKPDKKKVKVTLQAVVSKALSVIKTSLMDDSIELIEEFHDKEELELYDSEMMQVILNILKNSQDYLIEKQTKKAYIKIIIQERTISICDNAGGIPEDILPKVFDPYFSTKDEKNGSGLGLYMSKIIVEEHHNGKLTVVNTDDGACFNIEVGTISEEQRK